MNYETSGNLNMSICYKGIIVSVLRCDNNPVIMFFKKRVQRFIQTEILAGEVMGCLGLAYK